MYKIPYNKRFTGRWELVDHIKFDDFSAIKNSSGNDILRIFEAGFRTDIYGNITPRGWPKIWAGFGCGEIYHAKHAETWDLCKAGGQ